MPEHRFAEIGRAREHYVGVSPQVLPAPQPTRSGFLLSTRSGANSAIATNICYDLDAQELRVFNGGGAPVIEPEDMYQIKDVASAGFRWTYPNVKEFNSLPPSRTEAYWIDGMSAVVSPAYTHHITHFSEATAFLFHAGLHPDVYPTWSEVKQVVHVKAGTDDLAWNHQYARAAIASLPGFESIETIWRDQLEELMAIHSTVCFEQAGLVAQMPHEFGYFADPWEAQVFRESTFALFDVPEPPRLNPNQKMRTLVLNRKKSAAHSKHMTNFLEVMLMIDDTGLGKIDRWLPDGQVQPLMMEKLSFKEQITAMRFADVLVAIHGSALNNAQFMEPDSVVIGIMPSNYVEYEWLNFAEAAGVTFLMQPNTDFGKTAHDCDEHPAHCEVEPRPWKNKVKACQGMWYCDTTVDLGALEVLFRGASFLIRNAKRGLVKGEHALPWGSGRNPSGDMVYPLDD